MMKEMVELILYLNSEITNNTKVMYDYTMSIERRVEATTRVSSAKTVLRILRGEA